MDSLGYNLCWGLSQNMDDWRQELWNIFLEDIWLRPLADSISPLQHKEKRAFYSATRCFSWRAARNLSTVAMEEVRPWPRKSSSETLGSCEGCKITFELVLFHDCFHNVWSGNRWETLWARYSLHSTHQGVSEIQRCFKSSFACTKLHPLHEITGVNRRDVWSRKPSVWFNSSWIHARGATERALVWTDADFWVREGKRRSWKNCETPIWRPNETQHESQGWVYPLPFPKRSSIFNSVYITGCVEILREAVNWDGEARSPSFPRWGDR